MNNLFKHSLDIRKSQAMVDIASIIKENIKSCENNKKNCANRNSFLFSLVQSTHYLFDYLRIHLYYKHHLINS